MNLETLSLHNYGIYKGLQTFDLKTTNKKKPIILIGAMNGSGKTTFLQSIDFLLYGKNSNIFKSQNLSYEKFLEKSINKDHVDDGAQITLEFTRKNKGETERFKVNRSWKLVNEKIKETFHVYIDNEFSEVVTQDWDNYIEQILPSKVAQLFFFDGEKIEQLADLDQSKEVLKKSINSLLGLEIVTRLQDDLNEFRKKASLVTKDDKQKSEIDKLNKEINTIEKDAKSLEDKKIKIEDEASKVKFTIKSLDQELEKSGLNFYSSRKEIEKQLIDKQAQLEEIHEQIIDLIANDGPLLFVRDNLNDLRELLSQDLKQNESEEIKLAREKLSDDVQSFSKDHCKDDQFLNKLSEFLKKQTQSLDQNNQSLANIAGLNLYQLDNYLNESLPKTEEAQKKLSKQYDKTIQEIDTLELKIKKIPTDNTIKPLIDNQKKLKEKLIGLEANIRQFNEQIASKKHEQKPIEAKLKKLYEIDAEVQTKALDAKRFVNYSDKTKIIMENFKKKVLVYHIDKLQKEIADCFNTLIRKRNFLKKVQIDIETFELLLFDNKDRVLETDQLSAGERQLLAVAILWALARASNKTSPTIIDTPLGRLDSKHRLNLVDKYFPNASHQVILLSTDEEINKNYLSKMKNSIAKSYLVNFDTKENGSKVEEGYFYNA